MKPLQEQTLYEILEVPVDAPEAEIVKAWDRVNGMYGPGSLATYTLMAPDEAELLGRRLDEAITVLLDPEERRRYDARICGSGTPAPVAGRGEDGTAQRPPAPAPKEAPSHVLHAAPEPLRKLPPIIPPKAPAVEAAPPILLLSRPVEERAPLALVTPAPVPQPIPLATPVPLSPPFAAVEPKPASTPPPVAPAAAPPAAASPAPLPRHVTQELVIPPGARFTGEILRRAREARGLTVAQMCERTKVIRHHIENLEADRYDRLPAAVYLRGILMALAKELRLDGQKVARSYLEAMQGAAPPPPPAPRR
ncbi:MAG TPA: helix-turn-helix domain-containing protein [Anaeromyxobacteraceae bacterium]|nr:helix-turn-helix domain-containing protein [Anaeromyxobacteraceae bacterium]